MVCKNCGAENMEGSSFCIECGSKLAEMQKEPVEQEILHQEEIAEEIPQQAQPPVEEIQYQEIPQQQTESNQTPPQAGNAMDDEVTVKRIRDMAKLCSILWIVLGGIQILSCVGVIAGAWNVVMGIRGVKFAESIVPGNRAVYTYYDNAMTSMIIGAVINFTLGLFVGVALSVFDFIIRDQVIKNKRAFGA